MIFNIVKEAIDNKMKTIITSSIYYLKNTEVQSSLYNKAVVAETINNSKTIYKIANHEDYLRMAKSGTISVYEPIDAKISNFRILINADSKQEAFQNLSTIKSRFEEVGFSVDIIKSNNKYGLKCSSKELYNTNKLYSFAEEVTKGLSFDLSELKVGELKRFAHSLDSNGNKDTIINIGTI